MIQLMTYSKQNDQQWLLTEYDREEAVIHFNSFEFEISLSDLYDEVDFSLNSVG
ncbi:hypothetical protein [Dactylococcopsis salina]|uniref:hypothetical protein n=1 Tax=Dactylococcopsis salina TaxID=292566 RepID=UPI0002DB6E23|nr:hypothetical protein [Dactylococcopsis salina]